MRLVACSLFCCVIGLAIWVSPALSQTDFQSPPSQISGVVNDAGARSSSTQPSWPGLPYFNGSRESQPVGSNSFNLDSTSALNSEFPQDVGLSKAIEKLEFDNLPSTFYPGSSEAPSEIVVSESLNARWSGLAEFQASEDGMPAPLWRYEKLFAASSSDQDTEADLDSPYGDLSLILTPSVERNIRYFQTVIPDRFQEWLSRFFRYKPAVEQIFEELGIPHELVYLSLVESGFNPRAYSRARAAGPWQFMKATGRIYGLRVNWYLDERRDPVKSSVAAAQHLRDLYDRFGSWPLALAAYNAGSGKISRAIRKAGTRDFWKIAKTRYIRRETREYVPKFMAATIIASNPTLFGFHSEVNNFHDYDEVMIYNTVHLRSIAEETGIAFEVLRDLNPELRRSITPPDKDGYFLKVPVGAGTQVASIREQITQWKEAPPQITTYRVRRGDSLSVIAKRFQMTIQKLKDLNNLSGHMIHIGQKLRVSSADNSDSNNPEDVQWYRVRKGDSLWSIAKRYSVSIGELKILNNLRSSFIRVGHLLKISQ